ncbi:uncharacterized protein LOC129271549 [Lytechinus pictus]|uniref:uncharacterized protein LOC129271549 n=1 Tax=Lytechinus pictus TaxID=7653 RepID=UPI00240D2F15|nr:uncharacterized protein LOC129271549 [Lytechinus pictus]
MNAVVACLLIIFTNIISSGYGDIVDIDYSEEILDASSVTLQTNPNQGFVYDFLPPIPAANQQFFVFRFRVKSGGETHVALADHQFGQGSWYDIVFGINKNRYTAVRRCERQNCQELAAVMMPDAVSLDRIHDLWIGYNLNQGLISVGQGSHSDADLEARTTGMFPVSNLGFSTAQGTIGYWWFPAEHLVVQGCGSLLYQVDNQYKFRYTLPVIPRSSATSLDFKFSANANSNVRILLASEVGLSDQEPAYEIIIGSEGNRKSEIRRCVNAVECCPVVASANTPDILNGLGNQEFHIMYNGGLLKVFLEDDDTPILTSFDPNPVSVRAIGYSQGPHQGGYFDFPAQGFALGLLVVDTDGDGVYNSDLPLVPQDRAFDLHISFLVRAARSTLVLLSPEIDFLNFDGWEYEILLGGWNNQKTALRKCKNCGSVRTKSHVTLDPNEFRMITITINNGEIRVYAGDREELLFSLQEKPQNVFGIKRVAVTTLLGGKGRFVFEPCNLYK